MKASIQLYDKLKQKVRLIYTQLKLNKLEKTKGRKLAISIIETISLALYKQRQGIPTKKQVFDEFEPECSYKTLVVNINRFAKLAAFVLVALLKFNQKQSCLVKYTDSTRIPVCLNKNAKHHKTMQGIAQWGKTKQGSKGWFYGLKLHITTDFKRRMLSIMFTPGNIDDRKPFMKLNKALYGWFFTDKGYISEDLEEEFNQEGKRILFTLPKKNMKKIMTGWQFFFSRGRATIELNFRSLKMFHNLVTSMPRSVDGYFANYIYSLLSYLIS